jgi:predicted dehydrogenase
VRQVALRFVSAMGRHAGGGTFMPPPRDPWRQDPARSGGVLTDLGTHAADLVRAVAGPVTRVAATVRADTVLGRRSATNNAVVMALEGAGRTPHDAAPWHGSVHLCTAADVGDRGLLQALLVVGEAATLELDVTVDGATVRLHEGGRSGPVEIPAAYGGGSGPPFAVFGALPVGVRLFAAAVRRARAGDDAGAAALAADPEWATLEDGVAAQEVVDAARRSAEGGRWEEVRPAAGVPAADPALT